jgi:type I restriction enzyme S subunit
MQTINYLNLIPFSDFSNWSVRYLLETKNSYNEKYDFVKIGSFLRRNKININIENNVTYKRVTVKINNNGVYLRDTEKGINIGTKKQFLAQKGNYIISKIDARNGAFGIIPEELNNAIVTNDFPLFYVDETRININFLLLITTTKEFVKFAQSCSSGTTNRQRMDIDLFLEQKIPLPTIEEQKRIIGNYNTKLELAKQQEEQAKILEIEIDKYLFEELGIEHKKDSYEKIIGSFLKIYKYSKFDKWGANQNNSNKIISNNSFELKKIKDICTVSSGGTPSRERKEYYKGNIPWIKTGEVVNGIIYDTEEKITKEAIENSSAKIYPKGSLIIAMYGQGAT